MRSRGAVLAENTQFERRETSKANVRPFPGVSASKPSFRERQVSASSIFVKAAKKKACLTRPENTAGYWKEVYKAKYSVLGAIPDARPATDRQKRGWFEFCQWVKFHKPPFPKDHVKLILEGAKPPRSGVKEPAGRVSDNPRAV